MKRYLKVGIGTLIPLALVAQVFIWIIGFSQNLIENTLGQSLEWWGILAAIAGVVLILFLLGLMMTHIGFIKRWKTKIERNIIERIPFVKNIYSFGRELVDTFITDIKEDGDFTVVEVDFGGFKALGVLTDAKNDLGFIISAPSPLTGVVLKLPNYRKLDMKFIDAVQINTSLGRINGDKWK